MSNYNNANGVETQFDRPLIFVPNWVDYKLGLLKSDEKVLSNFDDIFSILIPSDVSFYLDQWERLKSLPQIKPYYDTFTNSLSSELWQGGHRKAVKHADAIQAKLSRGAKAYDESLYRNDQPTSYVDSTYPVEPGYTPPFDLNELASLLGLENPTEASDFLVVINDMNSKCLTLRLRPYETDQSGMGQLIKQTVENFKVISKYYGFERTAATEVGKFYFSLHF